VSATSKFITLKEYYRLTKPGIIRGNLVTAVAGFLLASSGYIDWQLLGWLIIGITFVIAAACVFNNVLDRSIDSKMVRTKNRAIATGKISTRAAMIYASALGLAGVSTLWIFTGKRVLLLGLLAFFSYVFIYGWAKRRSPVGTLVGTIPGAASLVAGYVAVSERFDLISFILFLFMIGWQMVHFYAISIYRLKDYKTAGIPLLSVKKGIKTTIYQMILFWVVFLGAMLALFAFGATDYIYFAVMIALSFYWLHALVKGLNAEDKELWATRIFKQSLIILLVFCLLISFESVLP
jgi:heme o synthase